MIDSWLLSDRFCSLFRALRLLLSELPHFVQRVTIVFTWNAHLKYSKSSQSQKAADVQPVSGLFSNLLTSHNELKYSAISYHLNKFHFQLQQCRRDGALSAIKCGCFKNNVK